MSKSTDLLQDFMLTDSDGNRSRVVHVRAAEAGLDHTEITTQSTHEKDLGIVTVHKVFSEEFTVEELEARLRVSPV